ILRDLQCLNAATTPARIGDLRRIDAAEERTAGALVFGQSPVHGVGQIRDAGARCWKLPFPLRGRRRSWRGRARLPGRRTWATQDAAACDDEITVRSDLE